MQLSLLTEKIIIKIFIIYNIIMRYQFKGHKSLSRCFGFFEKKEKERKRFDGVFFQPYKAASSWQPERINKNVFIELFFFFFVFRFRYHTFWTRVENERILFPNQSRSINFNRDPQKSWHHVPQNLDGHESPAL